MRLPVALGFDNVSDWVRLPTGEKLNLGTISVYRLVTTCVAPQFWQPTLDAFLEGKEPEVHVDADRLWDLVAPRKPRLADRFIPARSARDRMLQTLDALEAHIEVMARLGRSKTASAERRKDGLILLGKLVKACSVERLVEAVDAMVELPEADARVADEALFRVAMTFERIGALQKEGKRFNAAQAREELYEAATGISGAVAVADSSSLEKYAREADRIHNLFFPVVT